MTPGHDKSRYLLPIDLSTEQSGELPVPPGSARLEGVGAGTASREEAVAHIAARFHEWAAIFERVQPSSIQGSSA